jgi:hypothetical protein
VTRPAPNAQAKTAPSAETAAAITAEDQSTETHVETAPVDPQVAAPNAPATAAVTTVEDTKDSTPTTPLPELPPADAAPTVSDDESVAPADATASDLPQSPAAPAENPTRTTPVMKFDPLDFDPSQFSFNAGGTTVESADSNSIPNDADSEAIAGANGAADASNDAAPPAAPAPIVDRSLTMRLGPMPDAVDPPHRTAEQLATQLDSFAVTDMPLSRFVEMMSDLADVAVTLDPVELELAGISPRQAVAVDSKDVTVEKLLTDMFAKQRLEFVEQDGRLGVALAGGDRRKAVVYDVADLAGTADAKPIARLVQRFVAPESWTAAGGGKIGSEGPKLRIEQSQRIRHEVLIFCERLRLARSLPQRSKYPAAMLSVTSPYETMAATLKQPVTFTFLPWTRLADAFRHWQEASKLTILVDWSALADVELGPSSPVSCSAIDRSWENIFDETLAPIGLTWWAVNGHTIRITNQEALDDVRRIELYVVPKPFHDQNADSAALIESLQKELAEVAAKNSTQSHPPIMELDEPSGRLIVLGTPLSHRYVTRRFGRDAKQVVSQSP